MSNSDPAKAGRRSRTEQVSAVAQATADPHRLADILTGSTDREGAIDRLREADGVSEDASPVILDNQFSLLIQSRQNGLTQQLDGGPTESTGTTSSGSKFAEHIGPRITKELPTR